MVRCAMRTQPGGEVLPESEQHITQPVCPSLDWSVPQPRRLAEFMMRPARARSRCCGCQPAHALSPSPANGAHSSPERRPSTGWPPPESNTQKACRAAWSARSSSSASIQLMMLLVRTMYAGRGVRNEEQHEGWGIDTIFDATLCDEVR